MLPPAGFEASLDNNATPTNTLLSSAITTAIRLGVSIPTLASSLTSALPSSSPVPSSTTSSPHDPPEKNGQCELFGSFAILIQGSLGLCALLALVYKRWRERPQRPVKIWFFDVSKQVFGSVLVHIANLLMSMLSSGQFDIRLDASSVVTKRMVDEKGNYKPNPCSFYLLNLAIDVRFLSYLTCHSSMFCMVDCCPERRRQANLTPYRPHSASPSSSSSSASSPPSSSSRPSATHRSPSPPATTAIHPAHGGGSSNPSSTSWASWA